MSLFPNIITFMDEKLEKVNFLGQYLAASRSEDQIYEMAMIISRDVLGYDHCVFRKVEGHELISKSWYGFPREAASMPIKIGEGVIGQSALTGNSTVVMDTTLDPRFLAGMDNCRSELCVPIKYNGKVIAAINVESDVPAFFSETDISILETLASLMASALETNRLRGELSSAEKFSFLGKMASSILHDIRNDINQLNICSDFLRKPNLTSERTLMVADLVKQASDGIFTLIEDMFEYVNTGESKLNLQPENISELIGSIAEKTRTYNDGSVEIKEDLDNNITVDIDKRRFRRVLLNLFNNALEAMPDGGILAVSSRLTPAGSLEIKVSDTGVGIEEDKITQIWEPFYTHGKKHGTGLGMAIIRKIMDEHGFSIDVESVKNRGATFTIRIPKESVHDKTA